MRREDSVEARVTWLNVRGVNAVNRNDWAAAGQFFRQAYELDPSNAFSLNNLGYLSEMNGDSETAQDFYEKARASVRANVKVGYATRKDAEGRKLFQVADESDQDVESRITARQALKRRNPGPVLLKRRDNSTVDESTPSAQPSGQQALSTESPTLGPPQPPVPQLNPQAPAPSQESPLPPQDPQNQNPPTNQPPQDQPPQAQPQ